MEVRKFKIGRIEGTTVYISGISTPIEQIEKDSFVIIRSKKPLNDVELAGIKEYCKKMKEKKDELNILILPAHIEICEFTQEIKKDE